MSLENVLLPHLDLSQMWTEKKSYTRINLLMAHIIMYMNWKNNPEVNDYVISNHPVLQRAGIVSSFLWVSHKSIIIHKRGLWDYLRKRWFERYYAVHIKRFLIKRFSCYIPAVSQKFWQRSSHEYRVLLVSGSRLGIHHLRYYFHRWHSTFLPGNYGAIYCENLYGN